jgi:hypothetical protein
LRVEFVVDEFGIVVPNSVVTSDRTLAATRRSLTESLPHWRFRPAQVGACWVPATFELEVSQRGGGWRTEW